MTTTVTDFSDGMEPRNGGGGGGGVCERRDSGVWTNRRLEKNKEQLLSDVCVNVTVISVKPSLML